MKSITLTLTVQTVLLAGPANVTSREVEASFNG